MRSFIYPAKFLPATIIVTASVNSGLVAQVKRTSAAKTQPNGKKCDGAWSGIVNYKRVLKTEKAEGTSDSLKKLRKPIPFRNRNSRRSLCRIF